MAIPKLSGTKRKMHVDDNKDVLESETDDGDVSESLSDIEDAEIAPYFNKKEEVFYKRIIWEAMNKDFGQGGSRKRARKPKKAAPNKAVKASTEMDGRKKRSSKINYEVLNKLNEEDIQKSQGNHSPDFAEGSHGDLQRSNDKLDSDEQSLGGSYDDELDNDNAYCEDAEGRQAYEDEEDTCYPNEDYNEYAYDNEFGNEY